MKRQLAALLLTALSVRGGRVPRTVVHAVHDRFVPHGDVPSLFRELGFDRASLERRFAAALGEVISDGENIAGSDNSAGDEHLANTENVTCGEKPANAESIADENTADNESTADAENVTDSERTANTESIAGGETDGANADAPSAPGKEVD